MYWEKTVEYLFLWSCAASNLLDFASPLSGTHERGAGDAIFGNCARLLLIEFKLDAECLDSEIDKFDDFDAAKRLLSDSDSHHLLVYGEVNRQHLCLKANTYFSRNITVVTGNLPKGLLKKEFDKYLAQFLAFRKRDGRSGAKSTVTDFANVLGLNDQGQIVQACTLFEYTREVFPSLVRELVNKDETHPVQRPKNRL